MNGDLQRLLERIATALEKIATASEAQHANENGAAACSVAEAARAFGLNQKTVRAAIERGEIPSKRIGRRVVVPRSVLVQWSAARARVRRTGRSHGAT